jgi:hypothetical protein
VTYKKGTLRAKNNVETVNAAALDIDNITPEAWAEIQEGLEKSKIMSFWYTTYSHRMHDRPNNYKLRVVLALSRSVTAQEWDQIFPVLKDLFQADKNARDASRMFFGPYIPEGSEELHFSGTQDGRPLDVNQLLTKTVAAHETVTPDQLPPPAKIVVTKEMLTLLANKLARKSDAKAQISARMLRNLRDGVAFTEEGFRDEAVFGYIISSVVTAWDGLDTAKFTVLATPSLEMSGGVTPEQFLNKLERAKRDRQDFLERVAHDKKQKHEKSKSKAQMTRKMVGVDSYYVDETLPQLEAQPMGKTAIIDMPIQQAKVVQHGSDFYFWCNGAYHGPIQRSAFLPSAVKYLSPFEEIEKELFDTAGNLIKDFHLDDFVTRHGWQVSEVVFALGSNQTALTNDSLVLPYYPPLAARATYSWRVDLWLNFLFGGTADPVGSAAERVLWAKRWLYHYQDHDLLLPAILLVGATGAGKGLFAEFLAQAYEIPAVPASLELMYAPGTENNIYPVMVADEEFPNCSSAQLREGITAKTHVLKKKYQNIRKVRGYVRQIFILNDADRIKTFDVGVEAQKATAERFMYVPVTAQCREFLEALCRNNEHLQPGELQGHIAWMRELELHSEKSRGRFIVPVSADNQSFYETFYRQKKIFAVLNVICNFVCKRSYPVGLRDRYQGWPIEVTDGQVKIRTRPFSEYCEEFLEDRTKASIVRVLKGIAEPSRNSAERYWTLDTKHLYKWAEIAMEYSDAEIDEGLNTETASKVDTVSSLEHSRLN